MPIDWFTVAAQAVNFLVLVALLRYFLYGPVVRTMDAREERIASRLADAEAEREKAESERKDLERERSELVQRREKAMREAREEAERTRDALMREARERVERREKEWRRELDRRADDVVEEIVSRAGELVVRTVERSFEDLAGANAHHEAVAAFATRLEVLDDERRAELRTAIGSGHATVRSARELSDDERRRVEAAVASLVRDGQPGSDDGRAPTISHEVDETLVCGVELRVDGHRVAWSLREVVRGLRRSLHAVVEASASRGRPEDQEAGGGHDHARDRAGDAPDEEKPADGDRTDGENPADDDRAQENRPRREHRHAT